jgi:hypothetical protein
MSPAKAKQGGMLPRERDAYLNWLHIRAEEMVDSPVYWPMIEKVAQALLKRETLTANEVRAAMVS